ncbi:MAG TPA: hypothetical protein VFI43_04925 [Nitrosospira sp.]|nr:hypothetical protein [Nitrosospira sp.]
MSSDDNKGSWFQNPIPIVMVTLMAAGVLVKVVPLESARPGEPDRTKSVLMVEQDVEARLWQDPLSAVENEISAQSRGDKKQSETASGHIHKPDALLAKIKQTITDKKEKNKVTILAVNLFGGSFDASAEWRRRTRFAVLSALEFQGYSPENADALGYYVTTLQNDYDDKGFRNVELDIPYEWFSRSEKEEDERSRVLVLWLNEDKLLRPYKNLLSLLGELSTGLNLNTKVVGPAGSGTLLKLIKEAHDDAEVKQNRNLKGGGTLDIFSPTATISNCDLYTMKAVAERHVMQWNCFMSSAEMNMDALSDLPIVRTIATDDVLSAAVLWELWHRGINRSRPWPAKVDGHSADESVVPSAKCDDGLVLLREWDTQYAESLARNIQDGFSGLCGAKAAPLKTFSYLRGLDGAVPAGEATEANIQAKSSRQSSDESKDLRKQLEDAPPEHAEGRSQYDYLRRLTAEIERLDKNRQFAGNGIKAIGVLGSDVYDKLLILMALRARFPNKIFFTTELDARYLHADQKDWSRNLVVISSFGLTLEPALQKSALPFRDTYQTGIYLAALAALEEEPAHGNSYTVFWADKMKKWLRPGIFEIGRDQAVHLASPSIDDLADWIKGVNMQGIQQIRPNKPQCPEENWTKCDQIQPTRQGDVGTSQGGIILAVIVAGALLAILANRHLQQLFTLAFNTQAPGHSTAKSALIGAAAGLLITALIMELIRRSLNQSLDHGVGEPFEWFEGVSVWPSLTISFASLILMTAIICLLKFKLERDAAFISRYFGLDLPTSYSLGRNRISALFVGPHIDVSGLDKDGKRIADELLRSGAKLQVSTLWQNYLRVTNWREALEWVTLSTVTALIFVALLFFLYGNPVFPHRGDLVQNLNAILGFLNALMLWAVIFWTSYEARACARLINTLGKTGEHLWSDPPIETLDARLGVRTDDLTPYIDFRLITALTRRIQLLIYLPFISILFIIVGRSDLFDAMDFPPALIAVVVLSLGYAIYTEIVLRSAALDARGQILKEYEERLFVMEGNVPAEAPDRTRDAPLATATPGNSSQTSTSRPPITAEQIKLLMERIRNTHEGAYAPISQQPALQALLLPFGGLGGVQLIEYLMSFTISH